MKKFLCKQTLPLLLLLMTTVAALMAFSGVAVAHGEAIQVDPLQAKPAEAVTITGTGWEAGSTVRVTLEGTRDIVSLGTAEADAEGGFTLRVTLPEDLAAGSYRLVARLGDESAAVDFTVLEAAPHVEQAEAAESPVLFQRSSAETIAIATIVAALIGAVAFLVFKGTERRPRLQH